MTALGWAGWVAAGVLAMAWVLRRRGEWEVWKGHAHLASNLPLSRARDECARLWSGSDDDHVRAVVRWGGRVVVTVDWRDEATRRRLEVQHA